MCYLRMLIIALCVVTQLPSANAGRLTVDEAKNVASDFFESRDCRRLAAESALSLAQTKTDSRGEPVYYVFGATDGKGFIIVSAEGAGVPVIGYSYDTSYNAGDVPSGMAGVLAARGSGSAVSGAPVTRRVPGKVSGRKELSTVRWSQEAPFNNLIPGRRPTGCVGTAMAIIMKYHNWPESGRGSVGDVDFNVAYDWANMRADNYRSGYTAAEGEAVATLMSHAAASVMTDFGMSGSSAFEVRVPSALIDFFGYDAGVSYKKGSEMERREWDALIMSEIDENRPVLYCGQDVSAGHAFVCDGYETDGTTAYFHINWGWGGLADGYFASDNLSPQASRKYDFSSLTTIVYNIKPAESRELWSPIHLTGDGNQAGMTVDVENVVAGGSFTMRAGALKNVSNVDFSGRLAVGLFNARGEFKSILGSARDFSLASLRSVGYIDMSCAVDPAVVISDGDMVRLVTDSGDGWLPVASELYVTGEVPAKGNVIPYVLINLPASTDDVEVIADVPQVITGRDFEFKVKLLSPGKVVTVKANGFILTPYSDNSFRVANVNKELNVEIIVQNAADVVSKRSLWVLAGKLSELVGETESATVTDLTLFGSIDVNDFTFMRERMRLERLDLSGVSIVANGINPANAIPAKAFKGCGSLRSIILPSGLTTLKSGCFDGAGLRSIEIPASVSTYEYNVFLNCGSLQEVIVRRQSPAWINWCVFAGTPKASLVVPEGAAEAYGKAENWKDFKSITEKNPEPVTTCTVTFRDMKGIRFNALVAGTEVVPGTNYEFTLDADDSVGDAGMEVYANSLRLYPDESGRYKAVISENTLIYVNLRQPEPASVVPSPWKITGAAGGVGLVTEVVNVVPGKAFSIRANALAIPAGTDASLFYAAVLTDGHGNIKEIISPVIANSYTNSGNLPCTFSCQVKESSVREGNTVMVATSYNKKSWSLVHADAEGVCDSIGAVGNKVVYHSVTMPDHVQGAVIQGAVTQVVHGMPLSLKVTPVSADDVITITVNGADMVVGQSLATLSIPAVTEDLDIAVQVNQAGTVAYSVVNVKEGELADKIAQCPARLKVVGVILPEDFDAFRNHAGTIKELDLADVEIKGAGSLADAIPSNAFMSPSPRVATVLQKIILPATLRSIEANAFARCRSLSEITLPATVTYIGSGAFSACVSLKKIVALGSTPATLGMSPFPQNVAGITLDVPAGSEEAYRNAAYWNELSIETAVTYYNIQIDPSRSFNYNPEAFTLTKIPHPDREKSVTIGLPNCLTEDNEAIHPNTAFRLYDNGKDVTYKSSFVKYGQHSVTFNPAYTDPVSLKCPQNHVIDVVFYYRLSFDAPESCEAMLVNVQSDCEWKDVDMSMFDSASEERPTLYREGVDYCFTVTPQSSGMDIKVKATSRVMVKTGRVPEYKVTEELLVPDENGVYTVANLQGDVQVDVTMVPQDGAVISSADLKDIDAGDVENVTYISVTGEMTDDDFSTLRETFGSIESVDLSGITNESIPDNAFAGMSELGSVVLPESVTTIGEGAFSGCSGLESVTLPSVSSIGEGAFDGCDNLTSISINTVCDSPESPVARVSASAGICEASFMGINPNCLIFVADRGLAFSMEEIGNVIYNGAGSRVAVSDITLSAGHPFFTPGSFRLGERSISCTAEIECGERGHWRGIVLPFAPDEMSVAGESLEIGEAAGTINFRTFTGEDDERLSLSAAPEANRPYLMRLNGAGGGVGEISFSARGTSDAAVYDVPLTPAAGDMAAAGKDFTLYGVYESHPVAEGDYTLDDEGKTLLMADAAADAAVQEFGVYMRANNAAAPIMLEIDEALTVGLTDVTDDAVDGVKVLCDGSVTVIISDTARSLPVYDLAGRKVMDLKLKPGRNTVSLAPGVYIVCGEKVIM